MFRSNFTFGLAAPATPIEGAASVPSTGPTDSWAFKYNEITPADDGGNVLAIACVVNTLGQDDIYTFPFNGLCFNGGYTPGRGKDDRKPFDAL